MSRKRRAAVDDNDSLDLLLDTVSNVFGGVMFLTLLAALLILSRGATHLKEPPSSAAVLPEGPAIDDRIVQIELEQVIAAIETQQKVLDLLPASEEDLAKLDTIRHLQTTLAEVQTRSGQLQKELARLRQESAAQEQQRAAVEANRDALAKTLAEKQERLLKAGNVGHRNIAFRPMSMSTTAEAVLVLRYGRAYLLQNSPHSRSYNQADFFNVGTPMGRTRITPKPHRGQLVSSDSMQSLAAQLRRSFPPQAFHITIAVWDDSFGQFNLVCDALHQVGYRYRTIPCDDEAELSFGSAFDSWVQ